MKETSLVPVKKGLTKVKHNDYNTKIIQLPIRDFINFNIVDMMQFFNNFRAMHSTFNV